MRSYQTRKDLASNVPSGCCSPPLQRSSGKEETLLLRRAVECWWLIKRQGCRRCSIFAEGLALSLSLCVSSCLIHCQPGATHSARPPNHWERKKPMLPVALKPAADGAAFQALVHYTSNHRHDVPKAAADLHPYRQTYCLRLFKVFTCGFCRHQY